MDIHQLIMQTFRGGWAFRYRGVFLLVSLAAALFALALAACTPMRSTPVPTLVPTLAIVLPPTATATLSPTPAPATQTPTVTDTSTPEPTATETITPWVQDTATPGPSPTNTRTPTATRIPTRTRAPTNTPTITFTPTITLTPTPPPPALNLVRPGLMSKVLSPIQMELYAVTGEDGKVTIELVGEDGRVISRQVLDYHNGESSGAGRSIWISPSLPFEIDAAAETARLQVSTHDTFGRISWLSSVDLILLAVGRNEIYPPAIEQEPYLLRDPRPKTQVSGGLLVINALARPINDSPVIIELVNENGAAIITKQVVVPPPSGDLSHTPFQVEIPYKVDGPTPVRLTIRQEGSRIPGTVALISVPITLLP